MSYVNYKPKPRRDQTASEYRSEHGVNYTTAWRHNGETYAQYLDRINAGRARLPDPKPDQTQSDYILEHGWKYAEGWRLDQTFADFREAERARGILYTRANRARLNGMPPMINACYACLMNGSDGRGTKGLGVDHCHKSGNLNRGWLCHPCNIFEGHYYSGRLGPLGSLPTHLTEYLQHFGAGWHTPIGLARIEWLSDRLHAFVGGSP